jgi:hypothetical protein
MSFLEQFLKESSASRNTTPGRETSVPPPVVHNRYSVGQFLFVREPEFLRIFLSDDGQY